MSEPGPPHGFPAPMTAVVIGYARVSAEDQSLDLQRDALGRAAAAASTRTGRAGRGRLFLQGQLDPARTRELTEQMLVAGLPV